MEEEHVRAPSSEVFLIAFHWWDKTTNSLRGMLCNNSGPAACDFNSYSNSSLKWDEKQLTIDLEFPQNGKKMTWHEVWAGITATSFMQIGEMGEVGSPLKRNVTINGLRSLRRLTQKGKFNDPFCILETKSASVCRRCCRNCVMDNSHVD